MTTGANASASVTSGDPLVFPPLGEFRHRL
jgi:hypothetical protein